MTLQKCFTWSGTADVSKIFYDYFQIYSRVGWKRIPVFRSLMNCPAMTFLNVAWVSQCLWTSLAQLHGFHTHRLGFLCGLPIKHSKVICKSRLVYEAINVCRGMAAINPNWVKIQREFTRLDSLSGTSSTNFSIVFHVYNCYFIGSVRKRHRFNSLYKGTFEITLFCKVTSSWIL